jgi:hypothetical protein
MGVPVGSPGDPLDLLIVGAGPSGVDLAHHAAHDFPEWAWEIHEALLQSGVGGAGKLMVLLQRWSGQRPPVGLTPVWWTP